MYMYIYVIRLMQLHVLYVYLLCLLLSVSQQVMVHPVIRWKGKCAVVAEQHWQLPSAQQVLVAFAVAVT